MKRRHFILLLGGASSGALGVGTGAFSSVDAERGVEVNVVEDENAYLGLRNLKKTEAGDDEVVPEKTRTKVARITNQFAQPLELTVTEVSRDEVVQDIEIEDPLEISEDSANTLGVGEDALVFVKCETDETKQTEFTLSFDGDSGGATVSKQRTFEFTCGSTDTTCETCESGGTELTVTDVEFLNNGHVEIQADESGEVCAKASISQGEGGESQWTSYTSVPVGEELKSKQFCWGNNGGKIHEVEIEDGDTFTRDDS
ncbi:hypothetical protein [Halobellus rarus]|uniref:Uncharacterized protein n=1 Tax=Halobellus rarus TaxID=1126237 RepID=A0ABD6CMS8_9EURY|nr:hypothetical protein [Halobellus rarus]